MDDHFAQRAFFTGLGGLISGFVGLWIASFKRRREAEDLFLVTDSELRGQVVRGIDPLEFHRGKRERFRDAVFRLRASLKPKQKIRLDVNWST